MKGLRHETDRGISMSNGVFFVGTVVMLLSIAATLRASVFMVEQCTIAIVQRFGKFFGEASPGLHFRIPFADRVIGRVSLREQQLDVVADAKTIDGVFVQLAIAIQFQVAPEAAYIAFYRPDDVRRQIASRVRASVRAQVAMLALDDVFERCGDVAAFVKSELERPMEAVGHRIYVVIVTDVNPDPQAKASIAELAATRRMEEAETERVKSERALETRTAECEALGKALQGRGLSDQRRMMIAGLRESVDEFRRSIPGTAVKDVMNLIMMTQYFDMLKELNSTSARGRLAIPHAPGNLTVLAEQMLNSLVEPDKTIGASDARSPPAHELGNTDDVVHTRREPDHHNGPSRPGNGG
jgi:regulator of protease activity HflC (stomatin/prohibitin superfamily)